ncbi:hypothetical protein J437_LFUL015853 [Ladona fulva]|uniref:Elongator complex protein 1 n=1 Tax=Ladona fulva TaxID=123851 RepID=A0A8K0KHJ6_LADFU|nr:hypothetical protein J437_LFUL015853 [Ladona fulva]
MKNLALASVINYQLSNDRKIEKFCVEYRSGNVFFYSNGILGNISIQSGKENDLTNLTEYFKSKERTPFLIGMNYSESSEALCLVFQNGEVFLYTPETNDLQCVGVVSNCIKTLSWSPDEEMIALVSGEENLILMNSNFDIVSENVLHSIETGERVPEVFNNYSLTFSLLNPEQFITVGWGKKETQFHGSEGKAAAKASPLQCRSVFEWDDRLPYISWRGDGEMFVVSMVYGDYRQLRFFSREGVLQCVSEPVDGLEGPVSWKPSGSLVAAVQRLPNKHMIIFFEKNGLKHGEFIMPFKPQEMLVKKLSWNSDSTLLAVCCEKLSNDGEEGGFLQLWAVNNYHWYLKKVLNYNPYGKFVDFAWDINLSYRLHILCDESIYACQDYIWTVNHSKGKTEEDNACVAVVDGGWFLINTLYKLLITPFRQTVIPPPMSAYTIHFPLPINDVVFASFDTGDHMGHLEKPNQISGSFFNNFFVVLSDNSVVIFTLCDDLIEEHVLNDASTVRLTKMGAAEYKNTTKFHRPLGRFTINWEKVRDELGEEFQKFSLRHWKWVTEKLVFCCIANGRDTCICVMEVSDSSADGDTTENFSVRLSACLLGSVVMVALSHKKDYSSVIMQIHDGTLMRYDFSTGCMNNYKNNGQALPLFQQMEVCNIHGQDFLFGLTNKNRFFVDDVEILNDCSSFFVQSEYLLLTTYRHSLMTILLTKNNIESMISKKWDVSCTEDIRRIERGSRLVVAVAKHFRVIMQMPRGNLECIHPRALSLHIVADFVKRYRIEFRMRKYDEAFEIIRTQRIDLNALCDLDPLDFVSNLKQFVLQVKNPNWISLFLCELK